MQRNVPSLLPTSTLRAPPLAPYQPFFRRTRSRFSLSFAQDGKRTLFLPSLVLSFFYPLYIYMYIFFSLSLSPVVFLSREEDIITVIRLAAKTRFYVMTFLTNGYVHTRIDEIHGREKLGCESRESIKRVNVLVHTSNRIVQSRYCQESLVYSL